MCRGYRSAASRPLREPMIIFRISQAPRSAQGAVPGGDRPAREQHSPSPRSLWRAVWRRPLPGAGGITLEPVGPVQGGVPGGRAAGLMLALAVTAVAGAQYAMGGPFTTLAWLAIAPPAGLFGAVSAADRAAGRLDGAAGVGACPQWGRPGRAPGLPAGRPGPAGRFRSGQRGVA